MQREVFAYSVKYLHEARSICMQCEVFACSVKHLHAAESICMQRKALACSGKHLHADYCSIGAEEVQQTTQRMQMYTYAELNDLHGASTLIGYWEMHDIARCVSIG